MISANDVKRKKSKNISSTSSSSNAHTSANVKNYNLDEWLENSFRNSFINFNADGYIPPNVNVNPQANKPVVPDQMHSRYLKVNEPLVYATIYGN